MDNGNKVIMMARELGAALQEDGIYTDYLIAKQECDSDKALQENIGKFNLKRIAINAQVTKPEPERDKDKLAQLNIELQEIYNEIMSNQNMTRYNEAKNELDSLLNHVIQIINLSANGDDPATADPGGCTGSCVTCGGCH